MKRFVICIATLAATTLCGQTPAGEKGSPVSKASNWTAPKTPWGDPDLQGWFTNLQE